MTIGCSEADVDLYGEKTLANVFSFNVILWQFSTSGVPSADFDSKFVWLHWLTSCWIESQHDDDFSSSNSDDEIVESEQF